MPEQQIDALSVPWLPVVGLDGRPQRTGLRLALLYANAVGDLADDSAPTTLALYRLLHAIVRAALGPQSVVDLARLRSEPWPPPALMAYLDAAGRRGWFRLTVGGDGADCGWLQSEQWPADEPPKPVGVLTPDRASASNALWLGPHHRDAIAPPVTAATALRWLVTAQSSLAGTGGGFGTGPLAYRLGLIPLGRTLAETLLLSLPADAPAIPGDRPTWETGGLDGLPDDQTTPVGPLQALSWPLRRVLLLPGPGGTVRQVLFRPGRMWRGDPPDPWIVRGPSPSPFRPVWRDLARSLAALPVIEQVRATGAAPASWLMVASAGSQARLDWARIEELALSPAWWWRADDGRPAWDTAMAVVATAERALAGEASTDADRRALWSLLDRPARAALAAGLMTMTTWSETVRAACREVLRRRGRTPGDGAAMLAAGRRWVDVARTVRPPRPKEVTV